MLKDLDIWIRMIIEQFQTQPFVKEHKKKPSKSLLFGFTIGLTLISHHSKN